MAARDIIVVGASAGGVKPLQALAAGLPADLSASIFVVLHLPPWHKSELPHILSRSGPLPAIAAVNGETITPGVIYVAPPDYHLLVEDGKMELWHGPKENRNRPAINPLFRSAATAYRERVIGVVLSGNLDDGSAGLWWVKKEGGIAIIQDPLRCEHPEMPRNALDYVDVDYVLDAPAIGPMLTRLASGALPSAPAPDRRLSEWRRSD